MDGRPYSHKAWVLSTLGGALCLAAAVLWMESRETPAPIVLEEQHMEGHPLIGNSSAGIGLLLVEDFHCHGCRVFFDEVFPELRSRYLDTGKAYCLYIPIALFPASKPLANAALAVYRMSPSQFLTYVDKLFEAVSKDLFDGREEEELLALAEETGGIDLERLRFCIQTQCYEEELRQNMEWAKRIMGHSFGVPSLYVNGVSVSPWSLEEIEDQIKARGAS